MMLRLRRFNHLLLIFLAVDQARTGISRADFQTNAILATNALMKWYNHDNGLWNTTGWWNSANCVTTLADLTLANPQIDVVTREVWRNTYEKAQNHKLQQTRISTYDFESREPSARMARRRTQSETVTEPKDFLNGFYDDEGWWALAWIKVYDVTKMDDMLRVATIVFDDIVETGSNATCGGIWWDRDQTYEAAIANELYFSVAAHLANRMPNRQYYLDSAKDQWDWLQRSGMINEDGNVNDGLNRDCENNNGIVWSYNQGVILGALVELYKAEPKNEYIRKARRIADAAISKLSDDEGILHDRREPNLGNDGDQFKGIFMRNLRVLYNVTKDQRYRRFIENNADAVWNRARDVKSDLIGPVWSGPFIRASAATQSSGLDVLVAAAFIQE